MELGLLAGGSRSVCRRDGEGWICGVWLLVKGLAGCMELGLEVELRVTGYGYTTSGGCD